MFRAIICLYLAAAVVPACSLGQDTGLHPRPVPMPAPPAPPTEPTDPPARTVQDTRTQLSFRLPAGWNLSRTDGELSTFHLDARSAPRRTQLRAVANLAFNPYPRSTFSGALFYLSVTPQSTRAACIAQTTVDPAPKFEAPREAGPAPSATVGDIPFTRGRDTHGKICTEARDTVYTALRHGSCVRFDLVLNNFCGGEVSGARDITELQLAALQQRLESILQTVRFTAR